MMSPAAIQSVLDQIAAALQSGRRVWLVGAMNISRAGAPMPADVPPAPADYSGSELRYTENWQAQTAQFLCNRGRRFTPVDFPMTQNTAPENLRLFVAEGWPRSADDTAPAGKPTNAP